MVSHRMRGSSGFGWFAAVLLVLSICGVSAQDKLVVSDPLKVASTATIVEPIKASEPLPIQQDVVVREPIPVKEPFPPPPVDDPLPPPPPVGDPLAPKVQYYDGRDPYQDPRPGPVPPPPPPVDPRVEKGIDIRPQGGISPPLRPRPPLESFLKDAQQDPGNPLIRDVFGDERIPKFGSREETVAWFKGLPPERRQQIIGRLNEIQKMQPPLKDPAMDSSQTPMQGEPVGEKMPGFEDGKPMPGPDGKPPYPPGADVNSPDHGLPDKGLFGRIKDFIDSGRPGMDERGKGEDPDIEKNPGQGLPGNKDLPLPPDEDRIKDRPPKGLAEMVIGNPEVVKKKERIEKEPRQPRAEDIKEKALDRLKVPKEDRDKAAQLKKEAMRLEKEGRKDEAKGKKEQADKLLPKVAVKAEKQLLKPAKEVKENRPDLLKEVKGKLNPDVRVEKRLLRLEYKDSAMDQTEFVYSVEPPKGGLASFELVVEIPKDIANSVKDIDFAVPPDQVIKDDPVVKWVLKNVPQDSVAQYSFTVDGDVQNFETLAVAAGDKPGVVQRFVIWVLDIFGVFG